MAYRAPSWSWGSREGEVQYLIDYRSRERQISDPLMATENSIDYRHVRFDTRRSETSSYTAFSILDISVSLQGAPGFGRRGNATNMAAWGLRSDFACHDILDRGSRQVVGWAAFDDEQSFSAETTLPDDDNEIVSDLQAPEVWCARISSGEIPENRLDSNGTFWAVLSPPVKFRTVLLLRKLDDNTVDGSVEYERVGLGVIAEEDWFDGYPPQLISII